MANVLSMGNLSPSMRLARYRPRKIPYAVAVSVVVFSISFPCISGGILSNCFYRDSMRQRTVYSQAQILELEKGREMAQFLF